MDASLIPIEDLQFLLRWLDPVQSEDDRETVTAILNLAGQLASDAFLTHYKDSDRTEPELRSDGVHVLPVIGEALRAYADAGFFAAGFAAELGGLGLSSVFSSAIFAQFAAANVATAAYPMLTGANARLIANFGSPAQIDHFVLPMIAGKWFGTMCLSEPQAGSSLADIRTRAVADGRDGLGECYRLAGNKMWISGGDQDVSANIVHLVLAKIPHPDGALPEGTQGISLFIVPKILPEGTRNDIAVAGLNHKMGYRGTANCLLNFGEVEGATGWLVGEPGRGLAQMFQMMNEARISVGIGAAALAIRGYRLSLGYARERLQGRHPGERSGPPVPIIEHADVKRMLLAQKAYAEGALALCLFCASLVDRDNDVDASALLALLTPVAKTWSSEYGLEANDMAIQIHGGYGYTRDFDVEQLYRDNRLNPIHEGTTAIQAADLLGRKLLRDTGALALLLAKVSECAARASDDHSFASHGRALSTAWETVEEAVAIMGTAPTDRVLDNAVPLLSAFGHGVMGWLWLDLALAARDAAVRGEVPDAFARGKGRACRYFFEYELPKISAWLTPVAAMSDVCSGAATDEF